ncbi:cysteine dioxygenase family protein [Caenimonas soli]|uniref:cysteine dioxygenase family protein n=1 Tax=Caenimonas soli TaxID=2735555 RepID=UPI001555B337|nr:cysteine dioxygenase [Caenimonas soli]NPC58545.1 cysteine dioxygenase [Caenimonas soli]
MTNRLLQYVAGISRLVSDSAIPIQTLLERAIELKGALVRVDDWLPDAFAQPGPEFYRQHLLYGDPLNRFSVVSFVWGPGQSTPIHDHTVWGVVGMLRGAEYSQAYRLGPQAPVPRGDEERLEVGEAFSLSPNRGDIHRVRNTFADRVSISIHTYGGNIGRIERSVFSADSPKVRPFVSGYANALVPNLWAIHDN